MKSPSTSAKPKGFGFKKKKQAKKQQFGHASKHLIDEETRRKTRSPNDNIHLRKKLPEELHSLLGQANVYFVQGRVEEAMKMCHEVVRQRKLLIVLFFVKVFTKIMRSFDVRTSPFRTLRSVGRFLRTARGYCKTFTVRPAGCAFRLSLPR